MFQGATLSVKKWQLKFCRKYLITVAAPLSTTKDFFKKVLLNVLSLSADLCINSYTVVWTDYRFYSPKLCFFFPEAQTRKSKTNAYMGHLL